MIWVSHEVQGTPTQRDRLLGKFSVYTKQKEKLLK